MYIQREVYLRDFKREILKIQKSYTVQLSIGTMITQ